MSDVEITSWGEAIQERFEKFHADHPEVYEELLDLAMQGVMAGRKKLGIGQLYEVLRWNRSIRGLPDEREDFKLNDHYRSRYARLLMEREPDLRGMFDTRSLRSP